MFYRLYLTEKDPVDFTGLESYCEQKIAAGVITWLPIKKAIALEERLREKRDAPSASYEQLRREEHSALYAMQDAQRASVQELRDDFTRLAGDVAALRGDCSQIQALLGRLLGGERQQERGATPPRVQLVEEERAPM